ncbi:hypothetical protein NHQ30_004345 [Ciborinia camelliae]|nr:hypothetical protein NHQ30_004345 [Ciborinia camelliae]
MAMAMPMQGIAKRQSNTDNFDGDYNCDYYGNCYSTWGNWGRWVVLVLIIVGFVLLAFALSCLNSRRRRRQGMQPMYGTGWMAKPPPYGHYNQAGAYHYGPPPPVYTQGQGQGIPQQQTGNTFQSNDGYYGHHGEGIELQQPPNAYVREGGAGAGDVYQSPVGPPPAATKKGEGV